MGAFLFLGLFFIVGQDSFRLRKTGKSEASTCYRFRMACSNRRSVPMVFSRLLSRSLVGRWWVVGGSLVGRWWVQWPSLESSRAWRASGGTTQAVCAAWDLHMLQISCCRFRPESPSTPAHLRTPDRPRQPVRCAVHSSSSCCERLVVRNRPGSITTDQNKRSSSEMLSNSSTTRFRKLDPIAPSMMRWS